MVSIVHSQVLPRCRDLAHACVIGERRQHPSRLLLEALILAVPEVHKACALRWRDHTSLIFPVLLRAHAELALVFSAHVLCEERMLQALRRRRSLMRVPL